LLDSALLRTVVLGCAPPREVSKPDFHLILGPEHQAMHNLRRFASVQFIVQEFIPSVPAHFLKDVDRSWLHSDIEVKEVGVVVPNLLIACSNANAKRTRVFVQRDLTNKSIVEADLFRKPEDARRQPIPKSAKVLGVELGDAIRVITPMIATAPFAREESHERRSPMALSNGSRLSCGALKKK
jgi:hypothetical protein